MKQEQKVLQQENRQLELCLKESNIEIEVLKKKDAKSRNGVRDIEVFDDEESSIRVENILTQSCIQNLNVHEDSNKKGEVVSIEKALVHEQYSDSIDPLVTGTSNDQLIGEHTVVSDIASDTSDASTLVSDDEAYTDLVDILDSDSEYDSSIRNNSGMKLPSIVGDDYE